MRLLLGLSRPTAGRATVLGHVVVAAMTGALYPAFSASIGRFDLSPASAG